LRPKRKGRGHSEVIWSKKALCNYEGHGFKAQGHRQPFRQGHTGQWFTIEDHLVYVRCMKQFVFILPDTPGS